MHMKAKNSNFVIIISQKKKAMNTRKMESGFI